MERRIKQEEYSGINPPTITTSHIPPPSLNNTSSQSVSHWVKEILQSWQELFEYWCTSTSNKTIDWVIHVQSEAYALAHTGRITEFVQWCDRDEVFARILRARRKPSKSEPDIDPTKPQHVVNNMKRALQNLRQTLGHIAPTV